MTTLKLTKTTKLTLLLSCLFFPLAALAAPVIIHEHFAHIVWTQMSAVLVIFMTVPGLAMFYSGLVQRKNAISVISQCFAIVAISSILWVAFGYSLSFTNGSIAEPIIGSFDKAFLLNIDPITHPGMTHTLVFVIFQLGFAVITPALITGSVAGRIKFSALLIFVTLWEILVYYPICHWVWGGGWLDKLGMMDFAGGTVVHANAGIAGLVAALVLGRRSDYLKGDLKPHNITLVAIGTGILWIGWFGFNAGSAPTFDLSGMTLLSTQLAASSAIITWLLVDWIRYKKPSSLSILFGAIAGLVAITPASGYVGFVGAIVIGIITGLVCPWFLTLKIRLEYDDSLDVFGIHGVGGILGALLTGIFAAKVLGGTGLRDIIIYKQLLIQLIGIGAVIIWSAVISYILLKCLQHTIGLRVSQEKELRGLDIADHGEEGYSL